MAIVGHMRPSLVDGATLKKLRAERLITRVELSKRSGLSYSFLKLVEKGASAASDVNAHKIARALDVPVDKLGPREVAPAEPAGAA